MTYVAPRTCTVVDDSQAPRDARHRPTPLTSHANSAAYVLIAEPGAGKTTAFKAEAASQGGTYVTVRNFRTFDHRRVDSGRGQNRTLRSLSALWPPVFAGEEDVGPPKG